jgi:hypothetical protein
VFTDFWLVFTRVRHFWLVFTRVRQFLTRVHSCSQILDLCSLVFTGVHKFLTRVHSCCLVFTRVHSCSLVFWLVWSYRTDPAITWIIIYLLAFIQSTTLFRAFPAGNEVVHRLYTIDGADSRTVYIVPN